MSLSSIDPQVTEEYLRRRPESLYLERKSIGRDRLKPSKLANEIIGMLNADGGIIALGIEDNGDLEDLFTFNEVELLKYEKVCQNFIDPAADVKLEKITLSGGELIYLYHISQNYENMYERKDNGNVFKRVGDSNYGPLNNQEIDNLRHDKFLRKFEDQIIDEFDPDDIDWQAVQHYKDILKYDGSLEDLLIKRNLAIRKNGELEYRHSAALLFSYDPDKYIPSSYVRYVRYEGRSQGVGQNYNVIKDERIEGNIPSLITKVKDFMKAILSDFYFLNMENGKFEKIPEYPEDAWLEGIINALCHRSYNLQGNCIYIKHFDDRLEISNSGPLPAQVTVENIREQRFSRNPRIARVLVEMGYVRELNEGVKRIFNSMAHLMLSEPIYKENNDIVTLILMNKIINNRRAINSHLKDKISNNWVRYNATEKEIINYIARSAEATVDNLARDCNLSVQATRIYLNRFVKEGILIKNTEKQRDRKAPYVFKD